MGKKVYLKDYKPYDFAITHADLHFDLGVELTYVESTLTVQRRADCPKNAPLVLDKEYVAIHKVIVNGKELDLNSDDIEITEHSVTIKHPPEAEEFTVEIKNVFSPMENTEYSGIYTSGENNVLTSQCESEGFRRITPFIDRTDNLATYRVTMYGNKAQFPTLLSNGDEVEAGELDDGIHYAVREDKIPKPSYLFALVAGKLAAKKATVTSPLTGKEITLNIFTEDEASIESVDFAMKTLQDFLVWDENTFGIPYDLNNYNIVGVTNFNAGAMENKGLNIFVMSALLADKNLHLDSDFAWVTHVIAHEAAHNKAGNRVTVENWFNLSLKEGLATLIEQEYSEHVRGEAMPRIGVINTLREIQFPEDASPMSHPVRPESYQSIGNFYTTTIYQKGAAILRMMRTFLGDELWHKALTEYFTRYDGQAASIDKFVSVIEEIGNKDLSQFKRWYSQSGTPVVDAEEHYDPDTQTYTLTLHQNTPPTADQTDKHPLHMPVKMALLDANGKEMPLQLVDEATAKGYERVLDFKETTQSFTFVGIQQKPTSSLFRGFSAPVKFGTMPHTDAEYAFLMLHDTDPVNQWEAGQKYIQHQLEKCIYQAKLGAPMSIDDTFIDNIQAVLESPHISPGLIAQILTPPSKNMMLNASSDKDIEAINQAFAFYHLQIAAKCEQAFGKVYSDMTEYALDDYSPANAEKRMLKNVCLKALLSSVHSAHRESYLNIAAVQAAESHNMTDTVEALFALATHCQNGIENRILEKALAEFLKHHQDNPAAVLNYLRMQAARYDTPEAVFRRMRAIMRDESVFNIESPSQVRALMRGFARGNFKALHDASGQGYRILADVALKADKVNSATAAGVVKLLTNVVSAVDPRRQKMIVGELRHISKTKGVSDRVLELVNTTLKAFEPAPKPAILRRYDALESLPKIEDETASADKKAKRRATHG